MLSAAGWVRDDGCGRMPRPHYREIDLGQQKSSLAVKGLGVLSSRCWDSSSNPPLGPDLVPFT